MPEQLLNNDSFHWARLKNGDPDALGYLYDNYVDKLFAAASRITDNRELAKDALQEVFIEIWNYRKTLGDVQHSQSYLIKVLRGILLKKLKKEKVSYQLIALDTLVSEDQNIEDILIRSDMDREKQTRLRHALSNLTTRQQLILKLRFYQGLTYDQIAGKLGMNYQSVNNLVFRTIIRLRLEMSAILMVLLVMTDHLSLS